MALPTQAEIRPVLLRVLSEMQGSARPRDVYPRVTEHFHDIITTEDLGAENASGTNQWRNRIQWARQDLVVLGVIDRSVRGVWQLTDYGRELAAREPTVAMLTEELRGTLRDQPPNRGDASTGATEPSESTADTQVLISVVPSQATQIADELEASAIDSGDPDRLERAVGNALAYLGFEVEVIGGAGNTDVLADAPLGVDRYRVVVDAKSTASGRVADAQINWLSIREHREAERADHSLIVGPSFAGGQLKERATEFDTSLIEAAELGEIVKLHADTPLSLTELRPLFESVPLARTRVPQLKAGARDRSRRLGLLVKLLRHIDDLNRAAPEVILAKTDTLYASIITQADESTRGTTRDDVERALGVLETMGAVRRANGDGYVSQTSLSGAHQMLGALSTLVDDVSPSAVQGSAPADSA